MQPMNCIGVRIPARIQKGEEKKNVYTAEIIRRYNSITWGGKMTVRLKSFKVNATTKPFKIIRPGSLYISSIQVEKQSLHQTIG